MSKLSELEWPDYNDPDFYAKINENLDRYKIPESLKKKTDEELCSFDPTKFKMQPQQEAGSAYMSPDTPYKRFLIVNKPGSGKTCESIAIAEGFIKKDYHILVSVPRPLMDNYYSELTTRCAKSVYLKSKDELDNVERGSEQHIRILNAAKIKIREKYTIETHQTFIKNWHAGVYTLGENANRKFVIIIDEIHKLISDSSKIYQDYLALSNQLEGTEHRLIGLTGTPQNDIPLQFALLSNLFLPNESKFDIKFFMRNYINKEKIVLEEGGGNEEIRYSFKNTDDIKYRLRGKVGYYHSLRNKGYPTVKKYLINCEMSGRQTNAFLRKAETEFRVEEKRTKKAEGEEGAVAFFGTRSISSFIPFDDYSDIKKIKEHSIKMLNCLKIMKKAFTNKKLPGYIYDPYIELGVEFIGKVMEHFGYSQVTIVKNKVHVPNNRKPKFVILQGDTQPSLSRWAANVYRSKENIGGKKLAWILGTKVMGLGLNLGGTRTEIMYSIDWNWPNMNQIMDRGYRFCGSSFLPKKDRTIDIFFLEAVPGKKSGAVISIDKYMRSIADFKRVLSDGAEKIFHEVSVDCNIFSWANKNDELGVTCYDGAPPETIIDNSGAAAGSIEVHIPTPPYVSTIRIIYGPGELDYDLQVDEEAYAKMFAYMKYKIGSDIEIAKAFVIEIKENTLNWAKKVRTRLLEDLSIPDTNEVLEIKLNDKRGNNNMRIFFIKAEKKERVINEEESDAVFMDMDEASFRGLKTAKKTGKATPGCPKHRRVDEKGDCPPEFPFKRKNKQGYDCCYASATGGGGGGTRGGLANIKNNDLYFGTRRCNGYTVAEIIKMGVDQKLLPEGASGTKGVLCSLIKTNKVNGTYT